MATSISLRRLPQQVRGQHRVDTILDAAEQVLVEGGLEAATTNAIAARAHTSIGSLYQFFPNRDAILHALGLRYLDRMHALFGTLLSPATADLPLPEWIDRTIDALAAKEHANSGFKALFCSAALTPDLEAAHDALHRRIMEGLESNFASRAPGLDPKRRWLYITIAEQTAMALLPLTTDAQGSPRPDVVAELKRLLLAYLEPVFGQAPA